MKFSRRQWRHFWVQIHLWPGLLLGAMFVLLGLSGSILCFYPELDLWLNPEQQVSRAGPLQLSLQQVIDQLHASYPEYPGAWRLEMPLHEVRPLNARYYKPPESAGKDFAPRMVTLDPQTLTLTSHRLWGDYAMTWIYNLHYTLLLGKPGRITVGLIGVFCLLSLFSGLYLWWPSRNRWLAALRPRIRSGKLRATYDWHTLSGAYGLLLLVTLSFTGAMLALPEYLNPLVASFSPLTQRETPPTAESAGQAMISADDAVTRAQARFPDTTLRWLETPGQTGGNFRVNLWQTGDPGYRFPRTQVWVDAYSGKIIGLRDARQQTAGDTFLAWQHPLHNGEAFGLPGRILACLGGLLPALLWITGIMRWWQKRQARSG